MSLIVSRRCDVCKSDTGPFEVQPDDPRIHVKHLGIPLPDGQTLKIFVDMYDYVCPACKPKQEGKNVGA